ncbi:hypothetical protein TREES_T100005375 [Tupaia chinensis]|uniref:Uncharacterized protein n=1 Tax=Tupaia chinensis TaxID=246437 RepID=L9KR73_TUPCH|nr:hypothetical protein TREES_T100005375 [Tupaia chinensis]
MCCWNRKAELGGKEAMVITGTHREWISRRAGKMRNEDEQHANGEERCEQHPKMLVSRAELLRAAQRQVMASVSGMCCWNRKAELGGKEAMVITGTHREWISRRAGKMRNEDEQHANGEERCEQHPKMLVSRAELLRVRLSQPALRAHCTRILSKVWLFIICHYQQLTAAISGVVAEERKPSHHTKLVSDAHDNNQQSALQRGLVEDPQEPAAGITVRKPSAVYAQTYSEPEKEYAGGGSPGFLTLKQEAAACERHHAFDETDRGHGAQSEHRGRELCVVHGDSAALVPVKKSTYRTGKRAPSQPLQVRASSPWKMAV